MSTKRKFSTKELTLVGMMIAITAILAWTPLGLIPLPLISASTLQIPTIIIAIIAGPFLGGITGAAMGILTLIRAVTSPSGVLDPYFINPIISVLPRVLIGISAGYAFLGLQKLTGKRKVSYAISAVIGSFVNTAGVLGLLYSIYLKSLTEALGEGVGTIFLGIVATSGIGEAVASAVIATAAAVALSRVVRKPASKQSLSST